MRHLGEGFQHPLQHLTWQGTFDHDRPQKSATSGNLDFLQRILSFKSFTRLLCNEVRTSPPNLEKIARSGGEKREDFCHISWGHHGLSGPELVNTHGNQVQRSICHRYFRAQPPNLQILVFSSALLGKYRKNGQASSNPNLVAPLSLKRIHKQLI